MTLSVQTMAVRDLTPAPYNPRKVVKPGDPAWRKLETSLRQFGLVEPPVWNRRSGRVVGGHLRLAVLTAMGVEEVPVSVVDLDDAAEKALNVVLNNREAQGRYDAGKLADLLAELKELPALEWTGFAAGDISAFRLEALPAVEPEPAAEAGVREVTVVVPEAMWEDVSPRIDAVVRAFDLVTHTRGRAVP